MNIDQIPRNVATQIKSLRYHYPLLYRSSSGTNVFGSPLSLGSIRLMVSLVLAVTNQS